MQLRYLLGLRSGINNLSFLLLLEVILLDNLLQKFREKVTVSFSKGKHVEGDFAC
jgi:hypothetical protein